MITTSAVTAWLAKEGAALLLGALGKFLLDLWNDHQADQALKQAGAAEVAARVNAETVETIDAMDEVRRPSDDAVADSLRSDQF
ncbi:hypothetical protein CV770_34355 [Bradyrhizobium sp. AC87j1]|uniref:hypothetical protein n=1 Tax=Bradyrhizobium sp. AC87j1 TaxID=2055894 RepID=UPI000CECB824|nr:hypothetical protein [Bradyrhizobium sp. AC87j1]PPQ14908.1 hypothetical protein CV770_34355 [Bradyrhizobium sp. AC87j1]